MAGDGGGRKEKAVGWGDSASSLRPPTSSSAPVFVSFSLPPPFLSLLSSPSPPTRWYSSWDEAKDKCYKLDPSMFPSPSKAKLPMERCMRFLPHHQDTGGFFVCVLRKVRLCAATVCYCREGVHFPSMGYLSLSIGVPTL